MWLRRRSTAPTAPRRRCQRARARARGALPARRGPRRWTRRRARALRALLGAYAGADPRALRFAEGPHGKPALADDAGGLRFNLSHSGDTALIAVAPRPRGRRRRRAAAPRGRPRRDRPARLTADEADRIAAIEDPRERERAFLRAWVRWEAVLKCRGTGHRRRRARPTARSRGSPSCRSTRRPPPRSPSSTARAVRTWRWPPARRERAYNPPTLPDSAIAFDDRGLVPCIAQDWRTGEVLTLAYMNAEALERTRDTGEMHFWSRSREELWHKGATSRQRAAAAALRLDCDGDALLALVEPAGPACHTGERTCFFTGRPDARRAATRRCPRSSARSRARAARAARAAPTPPRCSPTRGSPARRSRRRPRRSCARCARRATSASPKRPPTCSTTWPCCCAARGLSLADAERVLDERSR